MDELDIARLRCALGHDVIARESSLPDATRITAAERPDVAIVIVHEVTEKALQLIDRIVHEASAIDIVLCRFAEYHELEGAFGRRAITERAKGILMERHDIDEGAAFDMLRATARQSNRKLVDIADAVVTSRSMLPSPHSDSSSQTTLA